MMLHEVRMRAFLLVPACLFLLWLTSAAACPEGEAAPRYSNSRFGFSLSWLPGHGTAREADNGDGVTVRDDQGFVLLAYGTRGYAVMGQRMEDAVAELSQGLEVSRRDCDTERGWCALSGVEGNDIVHITCFFGHDAARIVHMRYPKQKADIHAPCVEKVLRSFTLHDTAGTPRDDAAAPPAGGTAP